MTAPYAAPPDRDTKASNDRSIAFRYDARARLFAAARRVATRDGMRGLTIAAIATEASRTIGTVGRYGIDQYVQHIVDYCFVPLVGLFERQGLSADIDDATIGHLIEALVARDHDVSSLVIQARALAAAGRAGQGLRECYRTARREALSAIASRTAVAYGATAHRRAERAIRYYLDACARITESG